MKNTEHVLQGKDFPIPEIGSFLTTVFSYLLRAASVPPHPTPGLLPESSLEGLGDSPPQMRRPSGSHRVGTCSEGRAGQLHTGQGLEGTCRPSHSGSW